MYCNDQVKKISPRTKHVAIKYHHFESRIYNKETNPEGDIDIRYVDTTKQLADIFTKPLADVIFLKSRKWISGF